jgi:hypothetical protein
MTTLVRNLKWAQVATPFIAAIVVAALGVWAHRAQLTLDGLKDADRKGKEATVKAALDTARQDVEAAQAESSRANAVAADAKREAAEAVAKARPRTVTAEQRQKFLTVSGSGAKKQLIQVVAATREVEIETYARELMSLVAVGGWALPDGGLSRRLSGSTPTGLFLICRDTESARSLSLLKRALTAAGIQFSQAFNPSLEAGEIQVLVGGK